MQAKTVESEQQNEFSMNKSLFKIIPEFWRFMRRGCNQSNNIVAQVSSVSIFAFIDKEGIVTENQKYIDEVTVIDSNNDQVIIDLAHVASSTNEN